MPVEQIGRSGAVIVTGDAIGGYRAKVVLSAIELYLKTGMKANRAYTPANMRAVVTEYTGKTYARSEKGLKQAAADLRALMEGKTLDQVGAIEKERAG